MKKAIVVFIALLTMLAVVTAANEIVKKGGNFGIGTTNPAAKLDVAGNVKIVNHYFDANDDSWLRIRDQDRGPDAIGMKDIAVGKLYITNSINLGGVERTTWPTGGSVDWNNITNKPVFASDISNGRVKVVNVGCGSGWASSCDANANGYPDIADLALNLNIGGDLSMNGFGIVNIRSLAFPSGSNFDIGYGQSNNIYFKSATSSGRVYIGGDGIQANKFCMGSSCITAWPSVFAGYQEVFNSTSTHYGAVICPSGKMALSGGCDMGYTAGNALVGSHTGTNYHECRRAPGYSGTMTVSVRCVNQ
jgi:hypothetical protein